MRIALMADLHANRQAFEACLKHARSGGVERFVFLGDYVGYGADPVWVLGAVMELVSRGALAVLGNHDRAVSAGGEAHSFEADVVMAWTRGQLGTEARRFLEGLPRHIEEQGRLFVHATPEQTARWPYLDGMDSALRALEACQAQAVFCGHVHIPALYGLGGSNPSVAFTPVADVSIPLPRHRRWLAVIGSVGQPRDGHPAASYAVLDTSCHELTYHRVPYDVDSACRAIAKAGLPDSLALCLQMGR